MTSSVCVFCGSRYGAKLPYRQIAEAFGAAVGAAGIRLIYGGGHVGLMGTVADATMKAGGSVVGLIPERLLEREVGHRAITELVVTADMFERKAQMIATADAFAVLPGGLGTLDELLEVVTLKQLGYHHKPIVLIDHERFWDRWVALVEQIVEDGFAGREVTGLFQVVDGVEPALAALGIGGRTGRSTLRVAATGT